jgi:hypothetical protein
MSTVLALEHLHARVVETFELAQINCTHGFGWRAVAQHAPNNMPRIVWVPGDHPGGNLGELAAPKYPGQNPRPIKQLNELFTVFISASDPRDPENERAQYHVARMLYEVWIQAVYTIASGWFSIRSQTWVPNQLERRYGCTLRVLGQVEAPIVEAMPDEPLVGSAFAGLSDAIDAVAAAGGTLAANVTTELTTDEDEDL